jgi:recombination protein RecA
MAKRKSKKKTEALEDIQDSEKQKKVIEATIAELEKRFGENTVMRLGDADHIINIDVIPTGSLAVDLALGIGGIPRGRVTEIYGPESSGKTTLCLSVIAEAQKLDGTAAFVDMEHALDPLYAESIGVDIDNLYVSQPDTGEQALDIVEALIRSGAMDIVVLDSVAALVPRAEIEGEMGQSHVGLQARLMSQALRKISGAIQQTNTAMLFTNQLREKVGVMFGNPETTSGGRALKFYSSVRLDIRRIQSIKQGTDIVGNRTRVKVTKNKVAPPFRQAEFDIMYGEGFSKAGDILDLGTDLGIIEKRGAFYRYNDGLIGQGRENAKVYLNENPELLFELEMLIREAAEVNVPVRSADDDEADDTPADDE